ncbi:hypothetical protein [Nitrosomonas sp. Is37]|uniref:TRAFAC clade GTPase domain-containing protein n=1 Tax=Nitrosomonas sp. Is37 TaxID=3080535 RepID=UPI00294B3BF6|nr:hypothetical protein [Nitrosomonas sp. Is37]MDV6344772.1 hypothetical protein [Nitrosomonas sp. Is37]
MLTPEIVLLGGPNSGKTHYAGQLYGRLKRSPSLLKLRGTPTNLSALEEVLHSLEAGHAAGHTASGTWAEVLFPLEDTNGHHLDLCWPDYGGEQLKSVFTQREVSDTWRTQLCKANGWLLLIRLKNERTYPDRLAELANPPRASHHTSPTTQNDAWDANAYWVELLQILLHVAGLSMISRLKEPRLAVLLSCYDELEGTDSLKPKQIFANYLPLAANFIQSLWAADGVSIWGLSALGRLLQPDSEDEDFINQGPEYQGWIVTPEGRQESDLSLPLAWLLKTS